MGDKFSAHARTASAGGKACFVADHDEDLPALQLLSSQSRTRDSRGDFRACLKSTAMNPICLPQQSTPFIGRERELGEIAGSLADPTCRLLTLLGPGGIGKTRLAIQAASNQQPILPMVLRLWRSARLLRLISWRLPLAQPWKFLSLALKNRCLKSRIICVTNRYCWSWITSSIFWRARDAWLNCCKRRRA